MQLRSTVTLPSATIFSATSLSPLWVRLCQSHDTWWHQADGHLELTPRAETLSGEGQPAFLARRLQHARFETNVALDVPAASGRSSGLVAFQSETHYYNFAVRRTVEGYNSSSNI